MANIEFAPSIAKSKPLASLRLLAVLFKLRIVLLLLFAGAGGAFLAARGWPGAGPLGLLAMTGGTAAMGASALNQYLERNVDANMRRTRRRPLAAGAIGQARWVPVVALAMIFVPALSVLRFNPALAVWSVAGAIIYVGIYTVWLKPRTVLNIVIGGLAGTCAVLSGGAAAGHWADPGVIALGLLVFLWTPTHFWSVAILYREDYARADVPMLPVHASLRWSTLCMLVHAVATGVAALALAAHPALGALYLIAVALATGDLIWRCVRLMAAPTPARARSLFLASNTYLAIILVMICLEAVL